MFLRMFLLLGAVAMGSCTVVADEKENGEPDPKCFEWIDQYVRPFSGPSDFDKTYDRAARGGSYACLLGVTAEEVHEVLQAFKDALLYPSQESIEKAIRFPLTVGMHQAIPHETMRLQIADWQEWKTFRVEYIRPEHVAIIMCSSTKTLDIIPDDGAMIGLGLVWFNGGVKFQVGTINIVDISDQMILDTCKSNF